MDFNSVYQRYHTQLDEVESILHTMAKAQQTDLARASEQLLDAGGKRLRPLFAMICGNVSQQHGSTSDVAKVAAALELTHMATLVHDDVIDNATLRRGKSTVRSEFGNLAAMYTGDFLFARAIQLLAQVDDVRVHRQMSKGIVRLCEGEIEQIRDFFNWDQSVKTYLRRIERKTALLISLSCLLGALVSGGSERDTQALRLFGHYTGMAFQIIDDVLDFTGSIEVIGKPVGGDLRQGNVTLPALMALHDDENGFRLRSLVNSKMTSSEADEAIHLIEQSGALEQSKWIAERYLEKALRVLDRVSVTSVRAELGVLTKFVAERAF